MNTLRQKSNAKGISRAFGLRLRLISLMLVIATLLGIFPFSFASSGGEGSSNEGAAGGDIPVISVLHDGAVKKSLTLQKDGKETLTSVISSTECTNRSWQILNSKDNQWIDIYARTQESLDITYALVGSMLSDDGKTYIRCALKDGEKLYVSDPIEIVMAYYADEEAPSGDTESDTAHSVDSPALQAPSSTPSVIAEDEYSTHTVIINYIFDIAI